VTLNNLNKVRITELGTERVKKNLALEVDDIVEWCRQKIVNADQIVRRGKNWYVYFENVIITVNANSFTAITAHVKRP
jgi:hypothetical protein